MAITDLCVMATLQEFLQISKFSQKEILVFNAFQESVETLEIIWDSDKWK